LSATAHGVRRRTLTIVNQRGLHARAAAKFVKCAEAFNAEVTVTRGDITASGVSIMGLMMLAAAPGCEIDVAASGPQGSEALEALTRLVASGFDES
jgi:phosphocarrier protein